MYSRSWDKCHQSPPEDKPNITVVVLGRGYIIQPVDFFHLRLGVFWVIRGYLLRQKVSQQVDFLYFLVGGNPGFLLAACCCVGNFNLFGMAAK